MKKKLVKIFSFLMIFCLSFLLVGCSGQGDSSFYNVMLEKLDKGEITKEEFTNQMKNSLDYPLYATKVLYRSSSSNIGEIPEYEEYYAKFSLTLLYFLIAEYGYYDTNTTDIQLNLKENERPYIYDSIRYQISDVYEISNSKVYVNNNEVDFSKTNLDEIYFYANAKTSNAWNWNFSVDSEPKSIINNTSSDIIYKTNNSQNLQNYYNFNINNLQTFKSSTFISDSNYYKYLNQLLIKNPIENTPIITEIPNKDNNILENIVNNNLQSDVVKAIEYLLYCYSLNYQPNGITIKGQNVEVWGYDNIDDALVFIKDKFDKYGSYIGFSEDNKQKLVNAILDTVIGSEEKETNTVTEKTDVVAKLYFADEDALKANTPTRIEIDDSNATVVNSFTINRKYRETIEQIINNAYDWVIIGENTDSEIQTQDDISLNKLNINQRYLNSQIQDYWGNAFSLSARFDGGEEFDTRYMPEREYQSLLFMFSDEFTFDNIVISLRYSGNGITKGFDTSQYIEMNVNLNAYLKGEFRTLDTQRVKVCAGEWDASGLQTPKGFTHNVAFEALQKNYTADKYKDWGFTKEKGITVGAFNPDIGGGILSDGMDNYSGKVMIGKPIKLLGTTSVKDYYKIVEPKSDELPNNQFYTSGRFNNDKLVGANQCDYIEITFDVIKTSGDFNTNYNFQAGLFQIL